MSYCATCRRTCSVGAQFREKAIQDSGDIGAEINFSCRLGLDWIDKKLTEKNKEQLLWVGELRRTKKTLENKGVSPKTILQRVRLGDKIESITKAFGIKPCEPCKRRQALLNGEKIPPKNSLPEEPKTDTQKL